MTTATIKVILIIWHNATYNDAVMSTMVFDSVRECEAARDAIVSDPWVDGYIDADETKCIAYSFTK